MLKLEIDPKLMVFGFVVPKLMVFGFVASLHVDPVSDQGHFL